MDRQAVYDYVKAHLLKQNREARGPNGVCAYRDAEGRKCAIGALIPDWAYKAEIEGEPVELIAWKHPEFSFVLGVESEKDTYFLGALQRVHDAYAPKVWPIELGVVARQWGLKP